MIQSLAPQYEFVTLPYATTTLTGLPMSSVDRILPDSQIRILDPGQYLIEYRVAASVVGHASLGGGIVSTDYGLWTFDIVRLEDDDETVAATVSTAIAGPAVIAAKPTSFSGVVWAYVTVGDTVGQDFDYVYALRLNGENTFPSGATAFLTLQATGTATRLTHRFVTSEKLPPASPPPPPPPTSPGVAVAYGYYPSANTYAYVLSGTQSTPPTGGTIKNYEWVVQTPAGSTVTSSDSVFFADYSGLGGGDGTYHAELTCYFSDNTTDSDAWDFVIPNDGTQPSPPFSLDATPTVPTAPPPPPATTNNSLLVSVIVDGEAAARAVSYAGTGSGSDSGESVYLFENLTEGTYTVTVTPSGGDSGDWVYTVGSYTGSGTTTENIAVGPQTGSQTTVVEFSFTTSPPPPSSPYTLSGTIYLDGVVWGGATIDLTGDATDSVVSDSVGYYEFTGLSAGDYTITPAAVSGVVHDPISYALTGVAESTSDLDFNSITPSSPPPP